MESRRGSAQVGIRVRGGMNGNFRVGAGFGGTRSVGWRGSSTSVNKPVPAIPFISKTPYIKSEDHSFPLSSSSSSSGDTPRSSSPSPFEILLAVLSSEFSSLPSPASSSSSNWSASTPPSSAASTPFSFKKEIEFLPFTSIPIRVAGVPVDSCDSDNEARDWFCLCCGVISEECRQNKRVKVEGEDGGRIRCGGRGCTGRKGHGCHCSVGASASRRRVTAPKIRLQAPTPSPLASSSGQRPLKRRRS